MARVTARVTARRVVNLQAEQSTLPFTRKPSAATLTMALLTMALLTMALLTMALLTMALLAMALLTMALLAMALLTMALLAMATGYLALDEEAKRATSHTARALRVLLG